LTKLNTLLIIGASSFLGNKIFTSFSKKYNVVGTYFSKRFDDFQYLDIRSEKEVMDIIKKVSPDTVILPSAFTNVDLAETDKETAWAVNVLGTRNVAKACKENNAKLVYFSSDYIFDGENSPYSEESEPDPLNYYGKTKLEGEKEVIDSGAEYLIVRPAIMYGYNGPKDKSTFVMKVIDSLKNGDTLEVDNKRTKYPTLIDDLADATELLLSKGCKGIYNVMNDEPMTRYEWALKIAEVFSLQKENVIPHIAKDKVAKPRDVRLTIEKIRQLGFNFTPVAEGLKKIKDEIAGS